MTYEEVIRRLEFAKLRIENCTYSPETIEAIEIAILLLKKNKKIQNKALTDKDMFAIILL